MTLKTALLSIKLMAYCEFQLDNGFQFQDSVCFPWGLQLSFFLSCAGHVSPHLLFPGLPMLPVHPDLSEKVAVLPGSVFQVLSFLLFMVLTCLTTHRAVIEARVPGTYLPCLGLSTESWCPMQQPSTAAGYSLPMSLHADNTVCPSSLWRKGQQLPLSSFSWANCFHFSRAKRCHLAGGEYLTDLTSSRM